MKKPTIEELLAMLNGVQKTGGGWDAACPAHEDSTPSLGIANGEDGRILLQCRAGCKTEAVVAALGLKMSDLMPPSEKASSTNRAGWIEMEYRYVDERGLELFEVLRYSPKEFSQRRKISGLPGWVWGLSKGWYRMKWDGDWVRLKEGVSPDPSKDREFPEQRRVIYRLPAILDAVKTGKSSFVVEGEKDADNLVALGLEATTNPQGAGQWRPEYSETLRGATVVIIPDNDSKGRSHAQDVAKSLVGKAASVKVVELSGLSEKGDATDWIAAGGTKNRLLELAAAASEWTPAEQERQDAPLGGVGVLGVLASEVEPQPVLWLWTGRAPLGKLVIVEGDPGLGKTTLAIELIARCTTDLKLTGGCGLAEPVGAVIISAEDDVADTIRPRLEAAGAKLDRVLILSTVPGDDGPRLPQIPGDISLIEQAMRQVDARIVVFDPLMACLDSNVDSHKDQEVRQALYPLAKLAERTGSTIIMIRHLTKGDGANPAYRGGGSIAFVGAARAALLVGRDPEDSEGCVVAIVKSNLARGVASLKFRISEAGNGVGKIKWNGTSTCTAAQLLLASNAAKTSSALDRAKIFLAVFLRDGEKPSKIVEAAAKEYVIAQRTLDRARKDLGVISRRDSEGAWHLKLPGATQREENVEGEVRQGRQECQECQDEDVADLDASNVSDNEAE